jgi:DNA-directed RNA polymerase
MDWFQEIADICIKNKVSPKWWTPQGFLVDMQYEQSTSVPIKTAIGRTIRQHVVRIGNGKMDGRKTHNGIAANVIHSFDGIGGLLGLTINSGKNFGIKNWMTVHDSYGTTAGESQALYDCLRQATVAMFSENLLEIFRSQIQSMLPSTSSLPEVPPLGDMDITEVLKSNYYFS